MQRNRMSQMLITLAAGLALLGCDRSQSTPTEQATTPSRMVPASRAAEDPKTILTRAVRAHGGERAFTRWNCGQVKYKAEGSIVPGLLGPVILEDTFQLPGHFKRITRTNVGGRELVTIFVINHGKGWTKRGDAEPEPEENTYAERSEHPLGATFSLVPVQGREVRLTTLSGGNSEHSQLVGIRAQGDGPGPVDLYFDPESALLRVVLSARTETVFEEYKDI
jgi:hypothetical protein